MRPRLLAPCLALAACLIPSALVHSAEVVYRPVVVVQIGVADLDRAARFYEEVLDFAILERRDDLQFAHVATNVEGLQIGLSAPATTAAGTTVINLGVADVAAARTLLESRGVRFLGPTRIIPGKVALAEFADPDGNRLRLAGPPPPPD